MEQGKDLHRKHQTGQHAGNQAFPGVALPHAAVGFPPVARFIAQAAQHGISHGAQLRACNQAADDTGQQHEQQRVRFNGKKHTDNERQAAQESQETGAEKVPHIAAHNFGQAGNTLFARGVRAHARSGTGKAVRREKKSHGGRISFVLTSTALEIYLFIISVLAAKSNKKMRVGCGRYAAVTCKIWF